MFLLNHKFEILNQNLDRKSTSISKEMIDSHLIQILLRKFDGLKIQK